MHRVYRKQVKIHLQSSTRKMQVEWVLFLLIESSFICCALWVSCSHFINYLLLKTVLCRYFSCTATFMTAHSYCHTSWFPSCHLLLWTLLYCSQSWCSHYIVGYLSSHYHSGCWPSKIFPVFHSRVACSTWNHLFCFSSYNIQFPGQQVGRLTSSPFSRLRNIWNSIVTRNRLGANLRIQTSRKEEWVLKLLGLWYISSCKLFR